MFKLPKILGNSDPIHYAEMMPGVQTTSEYDAGLYIQGCDNGHNLLSISGVHLYNVEHLLGFFSVFNASHFSSFTLSKSVTSAGSPNRLGGFVDMQTNDSLPEKIKGEYAVGVMSSQGTLKVPIGKRSSLTLSARAAYLNLLYGDLLKYEENKMEYGFGDFNVTWKHVPDRKNVFWVDAYWGYDDGGLTTEDYQSESSVKWSNGMIAGHWKHSTDNSLLHQTLYYTAYRSKFELMIGGTDFYLDSWIHDWGYKGEFKWKWLNTGLEAIVHSVQPQVSQVIGYYSIDNDAQPVQHATEMSAFAEYEAHMADYLRLKLGIRASLFHSDRKNFSSADPDISLNYTPNEHHSLRLSASTRMQYLFLTGFSNAGMPTEFWVASTRNNRPQHSLNTSIAYQWMSKDKKYSLEAEVYYKKLWNQRDYVGTAFDFVYYKYNLDDQLITGSGYNYGANIMLEKRKGSVTGWLGYSFGRAWRKYPDKLFKGGKYPSSHERIHELNVLAAYRLNKKWEFSATAVAASGTPFTAVKYFYIVNETLSSEFASFNGNRLKPYFRIDLSANLYLKSKGKYEHGLNFSVYNASANKNHVFRSLKVSDGYFSYEPKVFLARVLPSVSYFRKF